MNDERDWGRRENIRWAIEMNEDLARFERDEVVAVAEEIRHRNRYVPHMVVLSLVIAVAAAAFTGDWLASSLLAVGALGPTFWYQWRQNASADAVLRRLEGRPADGVSTPTTGTQD